MNRLKCIVAFLTLCAISSLGICAEPDSSMPRLHNLRLQPHKRVDTTLDTEQVVCRFCDQPMTPIHLGPDKYEIWVHRGEQLKECHVLRLNVNVMKKLMERMKRFGATFQKELNADNPRVFGQPEQPT